MNICLNPVYPVALIGNGHPRRGCIHLQMFIRDTTARNKFLWRKAEDSNPYRYRYPGVQTLFAPVRGAFLTLPFYTGGPVLLGRSFRVHPVILGAGRGYRTPSLRLGRPRTHLALTCMVDVEGFEPYTYLGLLTKLHI